MNKVLVKRLDKDAKPIMQAKGLPTCKDIYFTKLKEVKNGIATFETGWSFQCPSGYYIELYVRSGTPKKGWRLANSIGIIDEDYRGQLLVQLELTNNAIQLCQNALLVAQYEDGVPESRTVNIITEYMANELDLSIPYVQIALKKREDFTLEEVLSLDETERGDGGFGSTNGKQVNSIV